MPAKCSVCTDPQVEQINADLINGVSSRLIASRYGVGYKSVQRHAKHLPEKAVAAGVREQVAVAVRMGKTTLEHLDDLIAKVDLMVSQCETDQDRKNFIAGIRELRECRTLAARLSGELTTGSQVAVGINVNTAPSLLQTAEWGVLMQVLTRHPEIREELTTALREAGL